MNDDYKKAEGTNKKLGSFGQILIVIGIVSILILAGFAATYDMAYFKGYFEGKASVTCPTLQPTVAPTPAPTPAYPSVVTYTVLSTTTANGDYRIITTNGQVLVCADIYDYNKHALRDTYTAEVVSYNDGKYFIKSPALIGRHYNDVRDYQNYYDNRYWWIEDSKTTCVGNMICA